jgi:hypothetical protein
MNAQRLLRFLDDDRRELRMAINQPLVLSIFVWKVALSVSA